MATVFTEAELNLAASVLSRSERGVKAMRDTLVMLDGGGIALDQSNIDALGVLLTAAWSTHPQSARDAMRKFVESRCEHGVVEGDYCETCNKAYKQAAIDNGL